ncbi:MAG: response regulator [Candidatus Marinimicrobia bacterium]|nr:response regulator [Candidatus Neomarinimicrobiota bacterium]
MTHVMPVNILLVEDDPGDQKLIKSSFFKQRILNDLSVVETGEEALEYLKSISPETENENYPDLILLDLNMPGMGGKGFLKAMKNDDRFKHIPVVILTTSDSDRDILESYQLHAAGYIKKPVQFEDFQAVVKGVEQYWFMICKTPGNQGS